MASKYEPKSLMGWVFTVAGGVVGIPVGLIKGSFDAMQGGSFLDGAADACEATLDKAGEFGDEHGGKIVSRVLTGVLLGVGVDIAHDIHDHDA